MFLFHKQTVNNPAWLLLQGHLFHLEWIWHRWEASWHSSPCGCALTAPLTYSPSFDSSLPAAVRDLNAKCQEWPDAQLVEQHIGKPLRLPWRRLSHYHTGTAKNEHRSPVRVAGPSCAASGKTWEKGQAIVTAELWVFSWKSVGKELQLSAPLEKWCRGVQEHLLLMILVNRSVHTNGGTQLLRCLVVTDLPQNCHKCGCAQVCRTRGDYLAHSSDSCAVLACWLDVEATENLFSTRQTFFIAANPMKICSLAAFPKLRMKPYTGNAYSSLSMV